MDLDEETYAVINASTAANKRLESFSPPAAAKELIMSMETVMEQRRAINLLLEKMKLRNFTEGPRGE
jgi:hypothetical protein